MNITEKHALRLIALSTSDTFSKALALIFLNESGSTAYDEISHTCWRDDMGNIRTAIKKHFFENENLVEDCQNCGHDVNVKISDFKEMELADLNFECGHCHRKFSAFNNSTIELLKEFIVPEDDDEESSYQ